jgi:hypothetical protein
MPLTQQERRCIDLACLHLASVHGGNWRITDILDDQYQTESSPEVVVSNGVITAAIEVKQLTGDSVFQAYVESMLSLERSLAPSCGGYYALSPCVDFRLPVDRRFRQHVKREIERVAPTLAPGQSGAIHIPREAQISLIRESGPGYIYCCHISTGGVVQEVSPRVTGVFRLVDDGQWEHSFVTDSGRAAFHDALIAACRARIECGRPQVSWIEEWELSRAEQDGSGETGVFVIAVTDARDVSSSVAEGVGRMLEKAKQKFQGRRWADQHIIMFENRGAFMTASRVGDVVSGFEAEELEAIDLIFLVDGDNMTQVWPATSLPVGPIR